MASETITRNDLKAILNEVLPPIPDEVIKIVTTSTLTDTGSGNMTYSCPTVTGYSCVGVLGYSASGTTTATTSMYDVWVDVTTQNIRISRTDALSSSYGLVVRLLYVKDGNWTS